MNTRLKQFLSAENISQSQFADTLKVTRASVSHVLSGRNNPGYDFIQEIMTAYPRLNMEWLILGKGKMYKDDIVRHQEYPAEFNDSLFPDTDEYVDRYIPAENPLPASEPQQDILSSNSINTIIQAAQQTVNQRKVSKIIVLFDDGSFQEI